MIKNKIQNFFNNHWYLLTHRISKVTFWFHDVFFFFATFLTFKNFLGYQEIQDDYQDGSVCNEKEAQMVYFMVKKLVNLGIRMSDIGIITPYWSQVALLRDMVKDLPNIEISTVDGFQGSEKVIFWFHEFFLLLFAIFWFHDYYFFNNLITWYLL